MNIWIVEDKDSDAAKAFTIVTQLALKERLKVKIFRDPDILWGRDLIEMPEQGTVNMLDHPPEIVILDLLDREAPS